MPRLNITIPHSLSPDEAASRIRSLLNDVKAQHADKITDLQEEWTGHTGRFACSVMGLPVSGILTIETSQINISGTLPFAAALFRGKLETMIRDHAAKLLAQT